MNNGIDLTKLAVGIKIQARTEFSLYEIEKLPGDKYLIKGGIIFVEPTETWIRGSSYGSYYKPDWLEIGMQIEAGHPTDVPWVSAIVCGLKIIGPDWEFDLTSTP